MRAPTKPSEPPVIRVYEGIEFEIVPLDNFQASPLCSTTCSLLASMITPEEEDHEDRVAQAKKARSCVKNPFGKSPTTKG
jgi:hypothetical protein